jgi:hypothetical protein
MKNKKYNPLLLENKVCVIVGAASLRSIMLRQNFLQRMGQNSSCLM